MKTEEIRMTLSILNMLDAKARITPKSAKMKPFISLVNDFDFTGGVSKVILGACEESIFPDGNKESYTMLLTDMKKVDKYE